MISSVYSNVGTPITAITHSFMADVIGEFQGTYSALKNPSELLATYLTPALVKSGLFNSNESAIDETVKEMAGMALDLGASFLFGGVYDVAQVASVVISGEDLMTGRTLSPSEKLWSMVPLLFMAAMPAGVFAVAAGKILKRVASVEGEALRLANKVTEVRRSGKEFGRLISLDLDLPTWCSTRLVRASGHHVVALDPLNSTHLLPRLIAGRGMSTSNYKASELIPQLITNQAQFDMIRLRYVGGDLAGRLPSLKNILHAEGSLVFYAESEDIETVTNLLKNSFAHVRVMPEGVQPMIIGSHIPFVE